VAVQAVVERNKIMVVTLLVEPEILLQQAQLKALMAVEVLGLPALVLAMAVGVVAPASLELMVQMFLLIPVAGAGMALTQLYQALVMFTLAVVAVGQPFRV
jgi:hypothetical protein